jgi:hypothetical protein
MLGDELVHARIAHELGREGNPLLELGRVESSIEKDIESFPTTDLANARDPSGSLIATPRVSRLDPGTPTENFDRGSVVS